MYQQKGVIMTQRFTDKQYDNVIKYVKSKSRQILILQHMGVTTIIPKLLW